MNVTNVLTQCVFNLGQYYDSACIAAYQKDGKQTPMLSFLAMGRILSIWNQLVPLVREDHPLPGSLVLLSLGLGYLSTVDLSLAPRKISIIKNEHLHRFIDDLLKATSKGCYHLFQNSNRLFNTVSFVSFIAQISLGFPVNGGMGLVGLCLIALKQHQKIPPFIENFFDILFPFQTIGSVIFLPSSALYRGFKIIVLGFDLSTSQQIKFLIETFFSAQSFVALPGEHKIQGQKLTKEIIETANFDKKAFKINASYVYASEVSQVLPMDYGHSLDQINTADLIEDIRAIIKSKNISLTEAEQEGFDRIAKGAIEGKLKDAIPTDIKTFKKIIKSLLHSIKNDSQNFEIKIKELAAIGNECVTGWTKDVVAMLHPETKNIRWAVHHALSVLRGEKIKEAIRGVGRLKALGDNNNVHITNIFQQVMWHRFRTYEAEMKQHFYPPSYLRNYLVKHLPASSQPPSWTEAIYSRLVIFGLHFPSIFYFGKINRAILRCIEDHFSSPSEVTTIVDLIQDQILPHHFEVDERGDVIGERDLDGNLKTPLKEGQGGKTSVETRSEISNAALTGWLSEIYEKFDINLYEKPAYLFTDHYGNPHLATEGVYLLLWDLGILTYTSSK